MASPTAPGESPCTQTDSTTSANANAWAAASAGASSVEPGCSRGTSVPSAAYARSAKPSVTDLYPAAAASSSSTEPGRHSNGRLVSYDRTADTTARACAR
ncbi:hypothetical protein BH18ACT8_BH18ACT8_03650 [soil metagenome]